jgi:ribonuclease Z
MDMSVFFAGTGGSVPSARRGLPALVVRRGGDRMLFDCGEGTQRQLVASVGLSDFDDVFLTHYHADHWLGLPGLLKTLDLRERERPLNVYGPRGLRELLGSLRRVYGTTGYELRLHEVEPGDGVARESYAVVPFAVAHRTRALGYAVVEEARPGRFDPERATTLGVSPGPDFARLQAGEIVAGVSPDEVMGPPRAGRKLVISGDTAPSPQLELAADAADLLVCEATFLDEDADRARETQHMTARQAAQLATDAGVRMLALTHLSIRYATSAVREEAQAVFENTVVPRDYDTIELPFPERGEPELVRWPPSERAPA